MHSDTANHQQDTQHFLHRQTTTSLVPSTSVPELGLPLPDDAGASR